MWDNWVAFVGVIQGLTLGWFGGKVEEQMLSISRS